MRVHIAREEVEFFGNFVLAQNRRDVLLEQIMRVQIDFCIFTCSIEQESSPARVIQIPCVRSRTTARVVRFVESELNEIPICCTDVGKNLLKVDILSSLAFWTLGFAELM